jgi:hypothetical protein
MRAGWPLFLPVHLFFYLKILLIKQISQSSHERDWICIQFPLHFSVNLRISDASTRGSPGMNRVTQDTVRSSQTSAAKTGRYFIPAKLAIIRMNVLYVTAAGTAITILPGLPPCHHELYSRHQNGGQKAGMSHINDEAGSLQSCDTDSLSRQVRLCLTA